MKTTPIFTRLSLTALVLLLPVASGAAASPEIVPLENPTEEATHRLVWSAEPGLSYSVETSTTLTSWEEMDGFPRTADGTTQEILLKLDQPRRFFRIRSHSQTGPAGYALIPAGTFIMGSPLDEPGRDEREGTQRSITLTRSFHMKQTEVTLNEWSAVRQQGPARGYPENELPAGGNGFNGDASGNHPVTKVSWWDVIKWCNLRSEIDGRTPVYYTSTDFTPANVLRTGSGTVAVNWQANGYRLPTEAEWEYACRAGTTTAFYTGALTRLGTEPVDPNLDLAGWYGGNTVDFGYTTRVVGLKQANSFGLYDTHGNVSEWCWDWVDFYTADHTDPVGPDSGLQRVIRGGASFNASQLLRSAARNWLLPTESSVNIGFRPVANAAP